jgi:hypothetical protein
MAGTQLDRAAVHGDRLAGGAVAQLRDSAADRDPAGLDPGFDLAPRA